MVRLRTIPLLFVTTWYLLTAWAALSKAAGETVLLDFNSPSCGPCQQMRPTMDQLKERGYPVREIDTSRDSAFAHRYNITHVPAFVVLVGGQEFARLVGATSYTQLERMLQKAGIRPGGQESLTAANAPAGKTMATTFAAAPTADPRAIEVPPKATPADCDNAAVAHLLESTVRITIQDPQGNSTGSGTIVDAREGEALVLTCGHLFRAAGGEGTITITLFQNTAQGAQVRTTQEGRLVDFDLQRDLGLISFRTHERVQVAPIAPAGIRLAPGSQVTTVGCNHGDNPTAISTRVTALNRYQGPANVEAAGTPVEGRSGGGMFNQQGQLVGVCFAADPQADEGLYAANSSIHTKLNSLGLAMIYQSPASDSEQPGAVRGQEIAAPSDPSEQAWLGVMKGRGTSPKASPPANTLASPTPSMTHGQDMASAEALSPSELALMDEIVRRGATSEVIVIIRPQIPGGKSEVITLQHASPNMIRALAAPQPSQAHPPAIAARPQGVVR